MKDEVQNILVTELKHGSNDEFVYIRIFFLMCKYVHRTENGPKEKQIPKFNSANTGFSSACNQIL